jgi:hypothetical protein
MKQHVPSIHRANLAQHASLAWRIIWIATVCAFLSLAPAVHAQPVQTFTVTVVSVYEPGERLLVEFRGRKREVLRLKGIRIKPCIQDEALAELYRLTWGRVLFLETASTQYDPVSGDVVGYLWADTVMVNEHLIARGLAESNGVSSRYQQVFREAAELARTNKLGYHGPACAG